MTGPRVEPLTSRVLSGDEWEASQYTRGAPPTDPTKPTGKLARILTGDEWEQAQQLPGPAVKSMSIPALPKFAPRDVTATGLDQRTKGKPLAPFDIKDPTTYANPLLRQLINPILDNPLTTIGTTAALTVPVVGPALGLYMGSTAAYHVAQYGWQKAAEMSLPDDIRKFAEADPERLSGEAAAVQAAMLGLAPLIHVGVKTARSLDFGAGMVEAGVSGVKGARFSPEISDMAIAKQDYHAQRIAEDQADLKATPLSSVLTDETAPVGEPRRVPQKDALAPSVADYAARRLAEDQADLSAARAADAQRVTNAPRRRPQGSPAAYFESPQGAETLGAVAARHGLPDDANPYHPSTGLAEHWDAGHANATESFKNMSETGFASVSGDEPSSVMLPQSGAGRAGSTVDAVARAKELVGPEKLREMAAEEWRRRGSPNTPESHMAAMEQVSRDVASSRPTEPTPSYPDGFAMGGMEGRIPNVPRRVYHGTASEFDVPRATTQGQFGPAIYLTGDQVEAGKYASAAGRESGGKPRVVPLHVSLKNPLVIEADVSAGAPREWFKKYGFNTPEDPLNIAAQQKVKDAGHDGIIARQPEILGVNADGSLKLGPMQTHYVAFDAAQVQPTRAATIPEGATPETMALANALKPSRFRGHSTDALAEAALDAQTAVEQAQGAVERARTGPLTSEAARADMENRGVSYSDSPEGTSVTAEKQLAVAKSRLSQIEREFALRGVSGDELAGVMQAAKEQRLEREGMQQDQTLADLSDKFNSPEQDNTRRAPLAAIEGTGPTRARGLSVGVQRKAVVNKLNVTIGDVPEYRSINMADQSDRAVALLESDPALARRVALGEAPAPDGLLPESVFVAVENEAIAQGDVATIRDLATGKLTSEATTMGQRIRALGERDPESPVAAIKEVITVRMGGAKNVPRATEETVASIRAMLKSVDVTHESWIKFVNSLRC